MVDSRFRGLGSRRLAALADRLSGRLLPPRCMLCGERGQAPCLDLCADCERVLPASDRSLQVLSGPLALCFAPFSYDYPLAHLVHALKYRGQLAIGRVLGTLLAERIRAAGLHGGPQILLPVPLHPARHAGRGYNQSTEIARWIARRLGRPMEPRLALRRGDTPPQVGLSREQRRRNLSGAFMVTGAIRGRHVTVIDDVTTTGSTLIELASVLRDSGAASVSAWCVARADRRDAGAERGIDPSPEAGAMR